MNCKLPGAYIMLRGANLFKTERRRPKARKTSRNMCKSSWNICPLSNSKTWPCRGSVLMNKLILGGIEEAFFYSDTSTLLTLELFLDLPQDNTTVTGHPGIGKSSFLFYVLLCRLSTKSPTEFQLSGGIILFDEGGPRNFSEIPSGTLALADSTPPSPVLLSAAKAQVVRIIRATPPSPEIWKWADYVNANTYVMDYFSSEEINTLGFVCDTTDKIIHGVTIMRVIQSDS
ncbi:hypothetical protein EDB89DRAFT_1027347 [Lactarius sanguifluus]|nr:hypothetical protein EDB89DRAFT_1027347 [Lactarius sanguifluus]